MPTGLTYYPKCSHHAGGRLTSNAGKIGLRVGLPEQPELTIHQGILAGSLEHRGGTPRANLVNRVNTRFISLDREYQPVNGPVVTNAEYAAADGQVYEQTLDLPFTTSPWEVQRHAQAFMEDARRGSAMTLVIDGMSVKAWEIEAGMCVRTSFDGLLERYSGTWLVEETELADDLSALKITLT